MSRQFLRCGPRGTSGYDIPAGRRSSVDAVTIEPGKRADFVLLDGNPLSDIRNTQRIRAVVLGGTLLDRKALDRLLATAANLAKQN